MKSINVTDVTLTVLIADTWAIEQGLKDADLVTAIDRVRDLRVKLKAFKDSAMEVTK